MTALPVAAMRRYDADEDLPVEHLDESEAIDEIDLEGPFGAVNDGVLTISLASSTMRDETSSPGYEIELSADAAEALARRILGALGRS